MTTEPPTIAALLADESLLAFCRAWEEQGRCSPVFEDYLQDMSYPGAGFARWAAAESDRPTGGDEGHFGGVAPLRTLAGWSWAYRWSSNHPLFRHYLPGEVLWLLEGEGQLTSGWYSTLAHAACSVLLVWPAGWVPKSER